MFIGRQQELNSLAQLYRTDKFQCVIMYGRRRVGKTALIQEFIKDKEAVYFPGQETNARENLEALSRAMFAHTRDFADAAPVFAGYREALEAVFSWAGARRLVFVIDEYPYLAAAYKGISSLLQTCIDKYKDTSRLFLILCGSSLSFMEHQVLGYQSPLYGRRTAQYKILPFDYAQTQQYCAGAFTPEETAVLYGVTGGVPLYLSLMDRSLPAEDNIRQTFLTPTGYLFEEPGNLIKQECREPTQYNAVIRAVAGGASRLSEIAGKVGMESAACSLYLSKLIALGILKREFPFREETSRKTIYRLADSMFRFWYRFVPDHMALIQRGGAAPAWERIRPQIPAFMGAVFEEICLQYLWRQNLAGQTPILFTDAGRWWGTHPQKRAACEIDIVADNREEALFAECKWTREAVGASVLETLRERSTLFHHRRKHYYLFAKTGFTADVQTEARRSGDVTLVRFEEV
jgi:AAA+ ATPase superfamily predicted ATPase